MPGSLSMLFCCKLITTRYLIMSYDDSTKCPVWVSRSTATTVVFEMACIYLFRI